MKHTALQISLIEPNKGQIQGLPKNPRFIKDNDFQDLVKAIETDDTFLSARDVLVFPQGGKYVIIGGEMRYRACLELKRKEIPVCILDENTSIEKLKEYTILDNTHKGVFDMQILQNDWQGVTVGDWGVNVEWNNNDMNSQILNFQQNDEITQDDFREDFVLPSGEKQPFQQISFIFSDLQAQFVKNTIEKAKTITKYLEMDANANANANAIYLILQQWAEQKI